MLPDESRSSLLGSSGSGGRQSSSLATPPRIGSSRVKSPLPAPAAYRSSCMSAAAKRYKVMIDLYSQWSKVWVTWMIFSTWGGYSTSDRWTLNLPFGKCSIFSTNLRMSTETFSTERLSLRIIFDSPGARVPCQKLFFRKPKLSLPEMIRRSSYFWPHFS